MSIHWWALVVAGVFEIAWAAGFKFAFRGNHLISAAVVAAMIASFYALWFAMRAIPIGTAYAVWTGIGAAGAATIGLLFLGEPATALRLICITLIIAGVVGLKIAAG